jgi:hypothetical protein
VTFAKWLDTFIDEKDLDRMHTFAVEGRSGVNFIPLEILIDHMKATSKNEQQRIKATIVRIDFLNGDVLHFFNHLAAAIAV